MANLLIIQDWYQLDFKLDKAPLTVMNEIAQLVSGLRAKKLADKWFYLFEGNTIRIRFHSKKPNELNTEINQLVQKLRLTPDPAHPFEPYSEGDDVFVSSDTIETFANMMAALSDLTIQRVNGKKLLGNYLLVERLSHCIFNNVYGIDTETYFLLKRMGVDFQSKDNPEQSFVDVSQKHTLSGPMTISLASIKIPLK